MTATKLDIHFRYCPFTKDRENLIWVVHRLEAFLEPPHNVLHPFRIGYINVCYIDQELVEKKLPTVWHYLKDLKGWCFPDLQPKTIWLEAPRYMHRSPPSRPDIPSWSLSKCHLPDTQTIQNDLAEMGQIYEEEFTRRIKHRINFAFVDYIDVVPDFQRQGIATTLYNKAAQWMAEAPFNMPLHASTIQSDAAKAVWAKMASNPELPVTTVDIDGRSIFRLDYRKQK